MNILDKPVDMLVKNSILRGFITTVRKDPIIKNMMLTTVVPEIFKSGQAMGDKLLQDKFSFTATVMKPLVDTYNKYTMPKVEVDNVAYNIGDRPDLQKVKLDYDSGSKFIYQPVGKTHPGKYMYGDIPASVVSEWDIDKWIGKKRNKSLKRNAFTRYQDKIKSATNDGDRLKYLKKADYLLSNSWMPWNYGDNDYSKHQIKDEINKLK